MTITATTTTTKPLPSIDDDHRPFWEALNQQEFRLLRCKQCGAWYWPVAFCRNHDNEPMFGNMEWALASGRGKLFAFNIHRRAFHPAFENEVPYVLGLVELEEGPMMMSRIVDIDPGSVKIGMPLEITFEVIAPECTLPYFRPASS